MSWPRAFTITLAPALSSVLATFLDLRVTGTDREVDLVGRAVHGLHVDLLRVDLHHGADNLEFLVGHGGCGDECEKDGDRGQA